MSRVATPMTCPYLMMALPEEIALLATLWPIAIHSSARTDSPETGVPAAMARAATTTLSFGWSRITAIFAASSIWISAIDHSHVSNHPAENCGRL